MDQKQFPFDDEMDPRRNREPLGSDEIQDEDAWLEELKVLAGMEPEPAKPAAPRTAPAQQPRQLPPNGGRPPQQNMGRPPRQVPPNGGRPPQQPNMGRPPRQLPPNGGRPPRQPNMGRPPRPMPPTGGRPPQQMPPHMRPNPQQMPPHMQTMGQMPPQAAAMQPEAPVRKSHTGGLIFYTLFFAGILAFYIFAYGLLGSLQEWLVTFEAAQPTRKCQEVFSMYFEDPDWAQLYEMSGARESTYEGKEAFAEYMEGRAQGQELSYLETSAGLAKYTKKYIVRLGSEKIASFTLTDNNQADGTTDIPDWQLGTVELFFQGSGTYYIETLAGCTTTVNGVALQDTDTIRIATTKVEEYLPEGITVPAVSTQKVAGLMTVPEIRVTDSTGKELPVQYDESTHTFRAEGAAASGEVTQEMKDRAVDALKTYAVYMSQKSGGDDKLASYFERGTDFYKRISSSERMWNQTFASYNITDETVKDCVRYTEDVFSARVSLKLHLVRPDGTEKVTDIDQSMFFQKKNDTWKCYNMTAVDVSEPVEKVRLTFRNGEEILQSELVDTSANQIQCPAVTAPEGKVFSGWMMEEIKENGDRVMHLMLKPDDSGKAPVPAKLEPMELYPLFEDSAS